jgi:hypothetical protein
MARSGASNDADVSIVLEGYGNSIRFISTSVTVEALVALIGIVPVTHRTPDGVWHPTPGS